MQSDYWYQYCELVKQKANWMIIHMYLLVGCMPDYNTDHNNPDWWVCYWQYTEKYGGTNTCNGDICFARFYVWSIYDSSQYYRKMELNQIHKPCCILNNSLNSIGNGWEVASYFSPVCFTLCGRPVYQSWQLVIIRPAEDSSCHGFCPLLSPEGKLWNGGHLDRNTLYATTIKLSYCF